MPQQGDPRIQITVTADIFTAAHDVARRDGWQSTSAWLRHLLTAWDGCKLITPRRKQLSVRLDDQHRRRLDQLARRCRVSRSQAFAYLIEQALRPSRPAKAPTPLPEPADPAPETPTKPAEIPGATEYEKWAQLIRDAARATPHKFGRKAFIAGAIDHLVAQLRPDDPEALRVRIRELLPELNRRDLVPLSRADLVTAMDPDLVKLSEIRHLTATFHFIDL